MKRYVALLRGINISGNNKISMKELQIALEDHNFLNVITYGNSGNVIFTTKFQRIKKVKEKVELLIKEKFNLDIPVYITTIDELEIYFETAPTWWNTDNKKIYDNMIFIIPPTTYQEVYEEIGEAKTEYERIKNYKDIVYSSFNLENYSKTNWIKTANSSINDKVTIRTANTIKKILELNDKKCN